MKLIDRTPLQDENGQIGIIQRIQGTLKYGFSWYPELEAQKFALTRLERGLAKGYVAIRNHTLGASGIIVPIALVGPAGIFTIALTNLSGQYLAKGNNWGTISGATFKPASINLITRTERLARALHVFIERQGVKLPQRVEPIVLAVNPGMHIDSESPLVHVVMADAIERWAASLGQRAPVLTVETAYELADRIINPRKPKKEGEPEVFSQPPQTDAGELSRAGAIFAASEEAKPFDPNDLGFAYEEESSGDGTLPPELVESSPAVPVSAQRKTQQRYLGMTIRQLAFLGVMLLVWVCVMIVFVMLISQNS